MKKKIFLICGIVLFVAIIAAYVAKVAFVEANKDTNVNLEMSEEEVKDLYNIPQTKNSEGKYERLTESEMTAFGKYYTMGDLNKDNAINGDDAQMALEIYTHTLLGQNRDQTKGEIFTGDVNRDGELSVDDAQILLNFSVYKPLNPNTTLEQYVTNKLYMK